MTCGFYAQLMNNGNIDITYTFFITLSFFFYIKWTESGGVHHIAAAYLSLGAGRADQGPGGADHRVAGLCRPYRFQPR